MINHKVYPVDASVQQQCLIKAYPQIQTLPGKNLVWDDGKSKSYDEMLDTPDLQDTLSIAYPAFRSIKVPPRFNEDPGRFRNEPLMKLVYGDTEGI